MTQFPTSAFAIREFADNLVNFLSTNLKHTKSETGEQWTSENFRCLDQFFQQDVTTYHKGKVDEKLQKRDGEFLWDFTAFLEKQRLLLAAESERKDHGTELERDFDKLLYAKAPVKLFMCWAERSNVAEKIRGNLQNFMHTNRAEFSPGEVFVLYCLCLPDIDGHNQDIAYRLQIAGEPCHSEINSAPFHQI